MRKQTKKQTAADRSRVNASYGRVANGVQVPIFALGRIMDAGLNAIAAGADNTTLDAWVKAAVDEAVGSKADVAAEKAGIRSIAHRL